MNRASRRPRSATARAARVGAAALAVGTARRRGAVNRPSRRPRSAIAGAARVGVAVLAVGTALVAMGGCGPPRSGSLGAAPPGRPSSAASPPASTVPPSAVPSPAGSPPAPSATGTVNVRVWFARAGKLAAASRTRPATPATSRLALTELAGGPSTVERTAGLDTAIAAGTVLDIASIAGGTATVACPASFLVDDGPARRLREAQVVYTLTQFPAVSRVAFRAGGGPAGGPLSPADVADLLPPIVVYQPAIGQRVSSPVTVSGTADVFEAVVSLRILDARGTEIATRFTDATCGTGCRGGYSAAVPYRVAAEQPGTIEVYQVSARDGSRVDVVDIPVTLAP